MTPARWYLVASDTVVLALIYLLAAYAILSLALRDDNILMRLLRAVTSPVRVPVAAVTPRIVPRAIVAIYAIACLYVVRIALFVAAQTIR
jgi:uncharacterized protein YggT (Ycf19 family)